MPTTPKGLPYPAATDPVSSGAANIQALALAVDPWLAGPLSTTPPANPVDGQLWAMQPSATDGIVWVFRYRAGSASAYKWEFVGGAPWGAAITTTQTIGAAGTWTNLGPVALPLPRAGEYLFSAWCGVAIPSAAAASPYLGIYSNAPAAVLIAAQATGSPTWLLTLAIVGARPGARVAGESIGLCGFGPVGTQYLAGGAWSVVPVRVS